MDGKQENLEVDSDLWRKGQVASNLGLHHESRRCRPELGWRRPQTLGWWRLKVVEGEKKDFLFLLWIRREERWDTGLCSGSCEGIEQQQASKTNYRLQVVPPASTNRSAVIPGSLESVVTRIFILIAETNQ